MYLIIGASGFIGRHLYKYCEENKISVLGTYCNNQLDKNWVRFDICTDDLMALCDRHLDRKLPDAVIICGANASIDRCKKDEEGSRRLNVIGTKSLLDQAYKMGSRIVFLSSEAVFDGNKGMYTEEDSPNPVTLYGRQKWEIEQYIMNKFDKYIIFRISRAVGSRFGEQDIFGEFYKKIINGEVIACLRNQSFCLTEVSDIARAIVKALDKDINGLYNLSGNNYISRYELANLYAEKFGKGYSKIIEKEYDEMPFLDKRHIYGGLNGDKLADELDMKFMDIGEIMDRYADTFDTVKM